MKLPLLVAGAGLSALSAFASATDTAVADTAFQRWAALPVLGYTEETELQMGALLLLFSPPAQPGQRGDSYDLAAYGTTRKQWTAWIGPDLYFDNGHLELEFDLEFKHWPARYYGMGNDSDPDSSLVYTMTQWHLDGSLDADKGLPAAWNGLLHYGLEFDIERNTTRFDADSTLSLAEPSRLGGWRTGLGYNVHFDGSDHPNWPRHGYRAQWKQVFFPEAAGKFGFATKTLDLRAYFPLPVLPQGALAFCSYWEGVDGDVPFDRLAQPDGSKHLRGIEKGLYRDRQSWVLQGEARTWLFWRFGGTLFYEVGKVGNHFGELLREDWHHAVGAGGRLALNPEQKVNARVDLSLVDGKHIGLTVYLREAF